MQSLDLADQSSCPYLGLLLCHLDLLDLLALQHIGLLSSKAGDNL